MEIYRRPHMIHTPHSDVRRRKQQAVRERERAKGAQSNLHFVWNNWQMIHRLGIGIEIEAPIDKRFNGLDSFSQLDSPSLNAPATNPAPTPPFSHEARLRVPLKMAKTHAPWSCSHPSIHALLWPVASPFEVEVDVDVNVEWAGVKWSDVSGTQKMPGKMSKRQWHSGLIRQELQLRNYVWSFKIRNDNFYNV